MRVDQSNNSKARLVPSMPQFVYRCILALSALLLISPLHADDGISKPDALVPIDTIAFNGSHQGIALTINRFCGDSSSSAPVCFYENPGSASDVQVLVLFEDKLLPFPDSGSSQTNQSFTTDATGLTKLNTFLTGLQSNPDAVDNVLVMLVYNSSAPPKAGSFGGAINGLEAIGQKVLPPPGHPWSIVGIPGMVPGKAAFNLGEPINGSVPGGLKGYIRESWLLQNDQSFKHRLFDFGNVESYTVTPVADAANYQNAQIKLAGNSFSPPAVPSGYSAGGFYAVQFNTTTMNSNAQAFWIDDSTGCVDFSALNSFLSDIPPPSLSGVAMASLGKAWSDKSGCSASAWTDLLETVELLGLNPDIFARAVDTNLTSPYSMISSNGRFGSGLAYQASAVLTDWISIQTGNTDGANALPQSAGILQGALERNNVLGQIYPATGDPAGLYSTELQEILFQQPQPWPMTPAAGATATAQETAFAWVVSCSQETLETDWNNGVPSSNTVVRQTAITLRNSYIDSDFKPNSISPLPSACDGSSFSATDLSNAAQQLQQEFDDISSIQSFFTTVLAPLVDNQTILYNDITDVAQSIANDELQADTTLTLSNSSNWGASIFKHTLEGLQVALSFFGEGPAAAVVGDFLSTVSSGFKFVLEATASSPSGQANQTDQYLILQSQLAQDSKGVVTQVTDSIAQWRNSMTTSETAILQDWGKMKAVSANLVAGGKWLFDPDDVTTMANAWDTLARQQTYYTYWPLRYDVGAARVSADGSAPGDSYPDTWFCTGSVQANKTDGDIIQDQSIQPFVDNGGIPSYENTSNKNSSTATPSLGAFCSDGACGIGDGQTYLPLFDIFSDNPEQLVVYMFSNSWDFSLISGWVMGSGASGTTGQGYANIVPADTMTNLTDQINANSANTAANFYPPTFWFNARSPNQLACGGSEGSKLIPTGFYSNPGTPTVTQTVHGPQPSVMQKMQSPEPLRALSGPLSYNAGDTMKVSITVQGVIQASDFYMAVLMPDGNTMFFVTELNPLTLLKGTLDNPASFRPLSNRDVIPTHEFGHLPNLFAYSFTGLEPLGTYKFFSAIIRKDAFRDDRINKGDILSLDMDEMTFGGQTVE